MNKLVGRGIVKTYGKKTVLQDILCMGLLAERTSYFGRVLRGERT